MIELQDVCKHYRVRSGWHTVFEHVDLQVRRGEKVGILGRNGAGKSTLIRLISGSELPTRGTIARSMTVSWPLALSSAFQGSLTGIDNAQFIARVYGIDAAASSLMSRISPSSASTCANRSRPIPRGCVPASPLRCRWPSSSTAS